MMAKKSLDGGDNRGRFGEPYGLKAQTGGTRTGRKHTDNDLEEE